MTPYQRHIICQAFRYHKLDHDGQRETMAARLRLPLATIEAEIDDQAHLTAQAERRSWRQTIEDADAAFARALGVTGRSFA